MRSAIRLLWPPLALAAAVAVSAMLFDTGCQRAEPPAPPPPEVLVTDVIQKDVPIYTEWVGTTVGFVNAQVMPRVQGYLLEQSYKDGAHVTAGQLLFVVDDRPYKAALDQALGDLVSPSAVLTTVSQVDPMKVTFPITEREYLRFADRVKEHQNGGGADDEPAFQLILADGSTYPLPGRFYVVNRQVDQQTGTILVQALFPNPDAILRPGLYARVRASTDTARSVLLVPERAVQEIQGVYQVAVVGSDDKVALRNVKAGDQVDGLWVIDEGLALGERVVTQGLQKVKDGIAVSPKPDTSDASVSFEASASSPPEQG